MIWENGDGSIALRADFATTPCNVREDDKDACAGDEERDVPRCFPFPFEELAEVERDGWGEKRGEVLCEGPLRRKAASREDFVSEDPRMKTIRKGGRNQSSIKSESGELEWRKRDGRRQRGSAPICPSTADAVPQI